MLRSPADELARRTVLTGSSVASELPIPLKSANAAMRGLVEVGILVEHGVVQPKDRGRSRRLCTNPELLGLTGSNPLHTSGSPVSMVAPAPGPSAS